MGSSRVLLVTVFAALLVGAAAPDAGAESVSGEAFGASVAITDVTAAKFPDVVLPSAGGSASTTVVALAVPGALTSGTVAVSTSGTTGAGTASSTSTSSVEQLNVLSGLVTANVLTAQSTSECGGGTATSDAAGTTFLGLVVNGTAIAANPPPNTTITIPGIGTVIINEQIPGGDGVTTSALTVNLVHVVLTGPIAGDIIVASAESDVDCAAGPAPTPTATPSPAFVCPPQPTATATPAGPSAVVSGEAYGVAADVGGVAVVGKLPDIVLQPAGGSSTATVLGVAQPGVVTTGTLTASTSGTTAPGAASSQSSAAVQQVNAAGGLVTADLLDAHSSSTCGGGTASSTAAGTQVANLTVDGFVLGNVTPAPNTTVTLPGGVTVVLNEQIPGGNGVTTSELTVNLVHVIVAGPVPTDIVVAAAHSDVDCAPGAPPPPPTTSVSGEAYAAAITVPPATLGRTPDVVLPAGGGSGQAAVLSIAVPGTLTSGTATVATSGTAGASTASASSTSTVQQVDVLGGLVTADVLTAQSNSSCGGGVATSDASGTQFLNLVVAGIPIAANPPPNTTIPVPGVGSVIINEQTATGNGTDTSALTVNLVHVIVTSPTAADVVVGSAHSDVNCAAGPAPTATPTATAATPGTCTPVVTPTATGPTPTPSLDHFACYEIDRPLEQPFAVREGVSLSDRFGPGTVDVVRPKRLCNPADKNDEDQTAPSDPDHLVSYDIRQRAPKFATIRGVTVTNQFGTVLVDVKKPARLLVPTAKSLTGSPPAPVAPAVDHFECHKIGGAKTRATGVKVDDQFGTLVIDVVKPRYLCAPANKNGEGVLDPAAFLVCYKLRTETPFEGPPQIFIDNQFGPMTIALTGPRELCVPSTVAP